MSRTRTFLICFSLVTASHVTGQIAGNNVNMVSGTQWPGGDPFLQRQNEPSMAISSRNPLHMLAGANDYRSVDLPGVPGTTEPNGDAWLGLFKSFDGGQTWTSTLVPGYPQDQSAQGLASPLKGLGAAADPGVRAGTNGLFFYAGLAFNRQAGGSSKVFVATFIDNNNIEGGDSINYVRTSIVQGSQPSVFEDKPAIAVDIPRAGATLCQIPALPPSGQQTFPAGNVYVAWAQFQNPAYGQPSQIMFSRSIDCGQTWVNAQQISDPSSQINQGASIAVDPNSGAIYVAWRVFATTSPVRNDSIYYTVSFDGGNSFSAPALVSTINPFDQGDTYESFRTNSYPSIALDAAGDVYIAWSQRGSPAPCVASCGDARIVAVSGNPATPPHKPSIQWSTPTAIDPWPERGHQIMPALAFSAGKLTAAWYDFRNDDEIAVYTPLGGGQYSYLPQNNGGAPLFPNFGNYIQDPFPPYSQYPCNLCARRQTVDVRAAQASPANPPSFLPSIQVSQYAFGSTADNPNVIRQLELNPPNLPMFQTGTLPFIGDYIDVAGPTFIANHDGTWRFNNLAADQDFTHIVWTDNRNIIQPADGNWANYTPPVYPGSTISIFDPTQTRPACIAGNTGDRNQDIYTSQLTPGLVVSARGNAKPLGLDANGNLIQREFPVTVQNTTAQIRYYQLTIKGQPVGGSASFLQFFPPGTPVTQIDVQAPALSSTSRSVFLTSTDPNATAVVSVAEVDPATGQLVPTGQAGTVTINSDVSNPNISNPNISNVEIYNPNISNPNISNPNISNPNISNPNISNVTIANPDLSNPNISNPNISNPNISNPNISNPNISNPNISNTSISDTTWTISNAGNTASAYSVKMLAGQNVPAGVNVQLIVSQSYNTPVAIGCTPSVQQHFVPVSNVPNVVFYHPATVLQPPATDPMVPAVALLPGETAFVTLRVVDSTTSDPVVARQHFNAAAVTVPGVVSHGANTGSKTPAAALVVVPSSLPPATATGAYSRQLMAIGGGGAATYVWSASGNLPPNIQLNANGVLSGSTTATGTFNFSATVTSGNRSASLPFTLLVNPQPSITTSSLPPSDQGLTYSQPLSATGGTGPLTWSISAGTLPSGLNLSGSTLTGTITAAPGSYSFTVQVTDANNVAATQPLILVVNAPPSITTTTLPPAVFHQSYSQPILAVGGTGTLRFTWTYGTVDGLSLSSEGVVSGIPASTGTFNFNVTVTDSLGVSSTSQVSLTVARH